MCSEGKVPKSSGFASLFGRKKRINGTKAATDDVGGTTKAFINTAQTKQYNGFIDSNASEFDPGTLKPAQLSLESPRQHSRFTSFARQSCSRTTHAPDYENGGEQRIHSHLKPSKGTRSGSVPLQISTLPDRTKRSEYLADMGLQEKSHSANAVYLAIKDPNYLMEALETLAAEQPLVARSIPKHAVIDTSYYTKHSLDNCLFDESVYQAMLDDSLKACQLLQDHLNDCADYVRARSPVKNDSAQEVNDHAERGSLVSNENITQQTIVVSPSVESEGWTNMTDNSSNFSSGYGKLFVPDVHCSLNV